MIDRRYIASVVSHPTPRNPETVPRVLLLSMYPLDRGLWGATTRITHMRDALARRVSLDVVSGARLGRTAALGRYLARRRLSGLRGIYVESSTALPGPMDLAFMGGARAAGISVVTYIRDAYQLFDEYRLGSAKARVARHLFRPAVRSLMLASSTVAFPSRGLAVATLGNRGRRAALLPPGARVADAPPVDPAARAILFVGALKHAASGGTTLVNAMEIARRSVPDLRLIAISRPGEGLPQPHPQWLDPRHAEGTQIDGLLADVLATVIPRPRTPYNDLAIPIKLMDYLGYARPMVVTDAAETARIVSEARSGIVTGDDPEALAAGIVAVAAAEPAAIEAWGSAAGEAARANGWDLRAQQVLDLLGIQP